MAAEFLPGGERLFQIHARTFSQRSGVCTERCLANGLAGKVSGKPVVSNGNYR